jgi:hypothetical protein
VRIFRLGRALSLAALLHAAVPIAVRAQLVALHDQVIVSDYGNSLYTVSAFVPVRFGVTVRTR